jgi:glycosyltransferase involved in cell wall biosynthesis
MTKVNFQKIALIGSYPPPYGGVSVHIQRLKKNLDKLGIENVVYDLSPIYCSKNNKIREENIVYVHHPILWFLKFFFNSKENVIHSHVSDWRLRFFFSLMNFFDKKIIISIHGDSLERAYCEGSFLRKSIIKKTLSRASYIIVMNNNIKNFCLSLEVESKKVKVIPSFIISSDEEESDLEILSKDLKIFIKSHSPIVLANAFKLRFFNNEDLYGLDLFIDLCSIIRIDYPNIGFIFCLPQIGDYNYFKKMMRRIEGKNLKENFLIYTKGDRMIPILKMSDIFIRPTNTDGDSISIRESLSYGIPVIASDVVPRPNSVVLFKNRDLKDLVKKVKYVIEHYDECIKDLNSIGYEDNFKKILYVYHDLK